MGSCKHEAPPPVRLAVLARVVFQLDFGLEYNVCVAGLKVLYG